MSLRSKTKRRILILAAVLFVAGGLLAIVFTYRSQQVRDRALEARATGLAALEAGDYPRAVNRIGMYLNREPDDTEALYAYALARQEVEEPDNRHLRQTIAILRRILDLEPEHEAAQRALLALYDRLGHTAEAIGLADVLLARNPADEQALRAKAAALNRVGRYREALDAAQSYNRLKPDDIDGHLLTFDVLKRLRRSPDQLVAHAAAMRQAHPDDPNFDLLTAIAYRTLQDRPHTLEWCRKAAARKPSDPLLVRRLVELFDDLGEFQAATDALAAALQAGDDDELRRLYMHRLWQDERWSQVVELLTPTLPEDAAQHTDLVGLKAMSLAQLGRGEEAAAYVTALDAQNDNPIARAWTLVLEVAIGREQIDPSALASACKGALAREPEHPIFNFFLGEAYTLVGEEDLALEAWNNASLHWPAWPLPLMRSAANLTALGRKSAALAKAREAVQRAPTNIAAAIVYAEVWFDSLTGPSDPGMADLLALLDRIQEVAPGEERTLPIRVALIGRTRGPDAAREQLELHLRQDVAPRRRTLLRLAAVSQDLNLGLESACLDRCEALYGFTPDLAFARASQMVARGDREAGVQYFIDHMNRPDQREHRRDWLIAWAQFLDSIGDDRASTAWVNVADEFARDRRVQQLALESPSVWIDTQFVERAVERVQRLAGQSSASWQIARGKLLLARDPGERAAAEAAGLLNNVVRTSPNLIEPRLLLAESFERLGNLSAAVSQLEHASMLRPESSAIALRLAQLTQVQGDFERAREALRKVTENASSTPEEIRRAAALLARQGETDQAITLLQNLHGGNPTPPDLLLAILYRRRRMHDQVEAICRQLMEQPSVFSVEFTADFYASLQRHHEAQEALAKLDDITMPAGMRDLLRAAFFARHAGPESALPQYRAAIDADPKQPEPWLAMATYLLDIERPADAQALLDEALAAVPDNPTLQFLSSRRDLLHVAAAGPLYQPFGVAMIQFPEHRDAAVAVLELIRHASGSRQPIEQTVAELRRLVELHPRFLPIQTLLIEVCILSGRLEEATSVARRAMQAFPAAVEPAWAAATSLSAQGRWAEALAAAEEWRRRSYSQPIAADLMIAEAHLRLDDTRSALDHTAAHIQRALEDPQRYASVIESHARALVASRQVDEAASLLAPLMDDPRWRQAWIDLAVFAVENPTLAAQWLHHANRVIPADQVNERIALAQAWNSLAQRFASASFREEAIKTLDGIATGPRATPRALVARAIILEVAGRTSEAERDYRHALLLDPDIAVARNNLAMILASRNPVPSDALALAQQAVEADPKNPQYLHTLAHVQARTGDLNDSLATIDRAVRLEPANAAWRAFMALALSRTGQADAAMRLVNQIVTQHELDRLTPDLREQVEQLLASPGTPAPANVQVDFTSPPSPAFGR